jgi:hypothetical protein
VSRFRAKVQKDIYLTEVSIELPSSVAEIDEVLRASKSTGKLVVLYNNGLHAAINVEQKTKINDAKSEQMRALLAIPDNDI